PDPPPLQLDLTATVNIVTAELAGVPVLPRDALRGAGRERAVLRVSPQGRAVAVKVEVGACDPTHCHILAGVNTGDEVIAAADTVPEGVRVRRR
ncbi:MAG: efflux RND transporter periplasmic adaptor subunit, partial [Acidobacteriota bacterium]